MSVNLSSAKVVAIDIGGTNTRVAVFAEGKIISIKKFKTVQQSFAQQLEQLKMVAGDELTSADVIGISAPGPADYEAGIFGELPNIPNWNGVRYVDEIKAFFNVKNVFSQNDANLMALAHHRFFRNAGGITQFFTISTGLGAGLIINDHIFTGVNGQAQEVANAPTSFKAEAGKGLTVGSLEYFASGSGIAFRAQTDTQKVFDNYETNAHYRQIVDEGIDALANMLATSIAILNPNLIVFDGSVARHNNWYIETAIARAKTRVFKSQLEKLQFKFAELDDDAALIGAYQYALDQFGQDESNSCVVKERD